MRLEQQAARLIARYHMLYPGERVLVALSGGADSVALLCVLRALGYPVHAYHLNHCLRGQESVRDQDFVCALCTRMGVEFTTECADVTQVAQTTHESVETAARRLRYERLTMCADRLNIEHIATAHTADDNLETMLFHLARGTGPRGMAGIPPVRGRIVRPLWMARRTEIEAYLSTLKQDFVIDSSNLTQDYTRNRIRHAIVPVLRAINPTCDMAAQRLSEQLRQDDAALQALAVQALAKGEQGVGIALSAFDTFEAVRGRMLMELLRRCGVPMQQVSARHIAQLEALFAPGADRSCSLPGGFAAYRENGCLKVLSQPVRHPIPLTEGSVRLWDCETVLTVRRKKNGQDFHKTYDTFVADCGTIHFSTLTARMVAPGDRLWLEGARGARQLKRIFSDRGIPPSVRACLAVIADCYGIIAVQAIGVDQSRMPRGEDILEFRFEGL